MKAALVAIAFPLFAQAQTIGFDLRSHHFGADHTTDANIGVYVAHDGWAGGVYRNSFRRASVWVGRAFPVGPVDVTVILASGYEGYRSPLLVVPSVKLGAVRLSATHLIVHLSVEVDL